MTARRLTVFELHGRDIFLFYIFILIKNEYIYRGLFNHKYFVDRKVISGNKSYF